MLSMETLVERIENQLSCYAFSKCWHQQIFKLFLVSFFFLIPQLSFAQIDNNFFNGGGIRVGDSTTTCPGNGGGIRFDADSSDGGGLQYCDGTNWLTFLTSSFSGVVNNGNSFAAPMIIGTNDNNTLAFETNGSTRMTIDTSGNVGIGTVTPGAKLDVDGSVQVRGTEIRFMDDTEATPNAIKSNGGQLLLDLDSDNDDASGYLAVGVNNGTTEHFRIDGATGNVGIGTDAPASLLDVAGIIRATDICDETGANCRDISSGWGGGGDFMADGSVAMTGQIQGVAGSAASPGISFGGDTTTGFYKSALNDIGVTVSGNLRSRWNGGNFSVGTGTALTPLMTYSAGTAASPAYSFDSAADTGMFAAADDELAFSTSGTERLRVNASGNVGIGTSAPSSEFEISASVPVIRLKDPSLAHGMTTLFPTDVGLQLNVAGASGAEVLGFSDGTNSGLNLYGSLGSNTPAATVPAMMFHVAKKSAGTTWAPLASSETAFQFKNRTTSLVTVMGDGSVGIGTTTPNVALDVNGSIEYTGTITDVSDRRLKEDIKPIEGALETITAVDGVSFIMKGDEKRRIEFGVIAQDVEEVLPELVHTADDEMKSKSVNYVGFIGWIIEAIKDLAFKDSEKDKRILELESKLDQQVKENDRQNREIESLKALIEEKLK